MAACNGKCNGDVMWTSTQSSLLRDARSLSPEIDGGSNHNLSSDVASLHLLESNPKLTRRARGSHDNSLRFRLQYDPSDIRSRFRNAFNHRGFTRGFYKYSNFTAILND